MAVQPPVDPRTASVSNPNSPNYNPNSPHYDPVAETSYRYGIDQRGEVDTGQDVEQNAEGEVNAEDAGDDGWLAALINKLTRDGRIDDRTRAELEAQARQLAAANGVATRPAPPIDSANYMSYQHGQLKDMVTKEVDPGGVGATGDQWITAGNAMIQFQTDVAQAIGNSEADWQGSAANNARGFMAGVGNWVGTAGSSAALAGTQMNTQSRALSTASSSMPEEVPYNPNDYIQRMMAATSYEEAIGIGKEAQAQYNANQEARQQAAQVVTSYDNSLRGSSTMPAFTAPPTMSSGGGGKDPGDGGDGGVNLPGDGSTGPGGSGSGSGGSGSGGGGGGGTYTPPQLPGGGGGGPSGPGGPGGPLPGGTNPGGTPGLPGGPGGPGGPGFPGGGPGGPGGGGIPPGGFPIGGGPFGGGQGGDGVRTGRGPGGGGFGPGGGSRGFGPGGGSGGGFGSGSGSESGSGSRGGAGAKTGGGMGAGAHAAEHAAGGAGRGGAGGTGGRGGMPMGGMAGARGQGGEDDEHQRPSYLVEADPDSLFGTDELTAPPVIGE